MSALNEDLLKLVPDAGKLRAAWLAVKANRGAPGIDGIGTEAAAPRVRAMASVNARR
jgi:2-succinyl-5-enolpyruvyl-6-hydroxy-3-cyclohexene-1-carboxylate synthase